MNIIEELYQGMLCPINVIIPKDEKFRLLDQRIGDEREYFAGLMSEVDKKRFQEWNELITKYENMYEYANFEYGFKLAFKLLQEVFQENRMQVCKGNTCQSEQNVDSLLEILIYDRTEKEISKAAKQSKEWLKRIKEQDKACEEMDKMLKTLGVSQEQNLIYGRVLDAKNAESAAYSEVAYRLGLRDGFNLLSEIRAM